MCCFYSESQSYFFLFLLPFEFPPPPGAAVLPSTLPVGEPKPANPPNPPAAGLEPVARSSAAKVLVPAAGVLPKDDAPRPNAGAAAGVEAGAPNAPGVAAGVVGAKLPKPLGVAAGAPKALGVVAGAPRPNAGVAAGVPNACVAGVEPVPGAVPAELVA